MFNGPSHWIMMLCDWLRYGVARSERPDLGQSRIDRERRIVAWILFLFIWLPICAFILALVFRPHWFA